MDKERLEYTEQNIRDAYTGGFSDGIEKGYENAVRNYQELIERAMNDLISKQDVIDLIMETDPFWSEGTTRAILDGVEKIRVSSSDVVKFDRETGLPLNDSDFVSVVRCKDCKYLSRFTDGHIECRLLSDSRPVPRTYMTMKEDDFCSYGEKVYEPTQTQQVQSVGSVGSVEEEKE